MSFDTVNYPHEGIETDVSKGMERNTFFHYGILHELKVFLRKS